MKTTIQIDYSRIEEGEENYSQRIQHQMETEIKKIKEYKKYLGENPYEITKYADIDRISTGVPASERAQIHAVKKLIETLGSIHGRIIPYDEIIREASDKDIQKGEVLESFEKLKRAGDIFEPKPGHISII